MILKCGYVVSFVSKTYEKNTEKNPAGAGLQQSDPHDREFQEIIVSRTIVSVYHHRVLLYRIMEIKLCFTNIFLIIL